jgi:hypothetical protein
VFTALAVILYCRRDEILKHIQPGSMKLLIYEGQQQPRPGQDM